MKRVFVCAFVVLTSLTVACTHEESARVVPGGSRELGRRALNRYGCGSCHLIPGVKGARALSAPPLIHFSRRTFIAGELANTPANLMRWVQHPRAVEPGTDMPELGVTDDDARDIAAYLESIK